MVNLRYLDFCWLSYIVIVSNCDSSSWQVPLQNVPSRIHELLVLKFTMASKSYFDGMDGEKGCKVPTRQLLLALGGVLV